MSPPHDDEVTEAERLEYLASLDKIIDAEVKVAERRSRQGRSDSDVPELWRSFYYLRQGYHLGSGRMGRRDHWQGGPVQHRGAVCFTCRKALRLVWDINCRDPRIRKESSKVFSGLDRLPLYYCFDCPEPTVYRVIGKSKIVVLPVEKLTSEESPFENAPESLPRRSIALTQIPSEIENLAFLSDLLGFEWLRPKDRAVLKRYFGSSRWGINRDRSQFGGLTNAIQGRRSIDCPNRKCATHNWGHPSMRRKRSYFLKDLAVIKRDCALEFETNCAQIVFQICWSCNTIHGAYRVD